MAMTGAERVQKHRIKQRERIAELEREVADLKNQQTVSNVDSAPTVDDSGHKVYSVDAVARATGLKPKSVVSAVNTGILSANKVEGRYAYTTRGVAIWRRRSGLTFEELMERALDIASGLH